MVTAGKGHRNIRANNDDTGGGRVMRPDSSGSLTCQGWGASRGIKGGSAPLARSYRGPDNVAGPLLGHLITLQVSLIAY